MKQLHEDLSSTLRPWYRGPRLWTETNMGDQGSTLRPQHGRPRLNTETTTWETRALHWGHHGRLRLSTETNREDKGFALRPQHGRLRLSGLTPQHGRISIAYFPALLSLPAEANSKGRAQNKFKLFCNILSHFFLSFKCISPPEVGSTEFKIRVTGGFRLGPISKAVENKYCLFQQGFILEYQKWT